MIRNKDVLFRSGGQLELTKRRLHNSLAQKLASMREFMEDINITSRITSVSF